MKGNLFKMRIIWYLVTLALIIDQVHPYPQPIWIETSANRNNRFGRIRNTGSSITSTGNGLSDSNGVAAGARRDENERISDNVEPSQERGSVVNGRASSISEFRSDEGDRIEETAGYVSQNENGSRRGNDGTGREGSGRQIAVRLPLTAASTRGTIRSDISSREGVRNSYNGNNRRVNNNGRIGSTATRESESSRLFAVNEARSRKNNDDEESQSSRRDGTILTSNSANKGDMRTLVFPTFNSRNEKAGRQRGVYGGAEESNQREALQGRSNIDSVKKQNERNPIRNLSNKSEGGVDSSGNQQMRFGERSRNEYVTGVRAQSGEQEISLRDEETRKASPRIEGDLTAADGRESQRSEKNDRLSFNRNYFGRGRFVSRLRNGRTRSNTQDRRIGKVSADIREREQFQDGRRNNFSVNPYTVTSERLDTSGRGEGERGERQRESVSRRGNKYDEESRLTKDDRTRTGSEENNSGIDEVKGEVMVEENRASNFRAVENRRLNEESIRLDNVPINVGDQSKLSYSGRGRYESAQGRRDGTRRKINSSYTEGVGGEGNRAISSGEKTKTVSFGNESIGRSDNIDSAVENVENRQSENVRSATIRQSENSQGFIRGNLNRNYERANVNGGNSRNSADNTNGENSAGKTKSYAVHSPSFELRGQTQEILLSDEEQYAYPKYHFEYAVNNPQTGDIKNQWEDRDGGVVKGVYSLHEPDGTIRTVEYISDNGSGFKAVVKKDGQALHPLSDLKLN